MFSGAYQVGWFARCELHGYGRSTNERGLFEHGSCKSSQQLPTSYDPETDVIAGEIAFEDLYLDEDQNYEDLMDAAKLKARIAEERQKVTKLNWTDLSQDEKACIDFFKS